MLNPAISAAFETSIADQAVIDPCPIRSQPGPWMGQDHKPSGAETLLHALRIARNLDEMRSESPTNRRGMIFSPGPGSTGYNGVTDRRKSIADFRLCSFLLRRCYLMSIRTDCSWVIPRFHTVDFRFFWRCLYCPLITLSLVFLREAFDCSLSHGHC